VDPFNFAPRVRIPTLMVNGRSDFTYPVQSSQLPLFRLLGVPEDRKRHALFEGGHLPDQRHEVMRDVLDWFDRYLGPVNPASRG
jgi:alpha-beta hydrolase superfamily lysophospholipase